MGLRDLVEGDYSPTRQLQGLLEAQQAAPAVQQSFTQDSPQRPQFQIHGARQSSPRDQKAVSLVKEYLGTPYVWGGESPKGFDCSGLLQFVWGKIGVRIPRVTYDQWQAGKAVSRGALRPGDAVFFRGSDARGNLPGHVGMYIGGGRFIEAPHTGATVRISRLGGRKDYVGARRYA
jgi:cell wall-associated NlpC family hydrolase